MRKANPKMRKVAVYLADLKIWWRSFFRNKESAKKVKRMIEEVLFIIFILFLICFMFYGIKQGSNTEQHSEGSSQQ